MTEQQIEQLWSGLNESERSEIVSKFLMLNSVRPIVAKRIEDEVNYNRKIFTAIGIGLVAVTASVTYFLTKSSCKKR